MLQIIKDYLKDDKLLGESLIESRTINGKIPGDNGFRDKKELEAVGPSFQMGPHNLLIKRVCFITIAFPNHEYKMRYSECNTKGIQIKEGNVKYFKCMPSEQYEYVIRQLKQHFEIMFFETLIDYDLFFEVTKNGNIHIHGRISFSKKILDKELKLSFHRIFKTPTKYIRNHVDIKDYEHTKWNDYENKKEKGYQTTEYPHFKNI